MVGRIRILSESGLLGRVCTNYYQMVPLVSDNPLKDPGFWERMQENARIVEKMPAWMKGSPVNRREPNKPESVGAPSDDEVHRGEAGAGCSSIED